MKVIFQTSIGAATGTSPMCKHACGLIRNMGNSIVVVRNENKIITALYHERELITISLEPDEVRTGVGDIYIAKVQNIVKNINGAFVEIAGKKICYLPLAENGNPVFSYGGKSGLKAGDEILVQIVKDTSGNKAPLVTVNLTLTGRFAVLVRGKESVGISSKVTDEKERGRLKTLVSPYVGEDYGFIVRTNAASAKDEDIIKEVLLLKEQYENITTVKIHGSCFSKLYAAPPSFIWEIRDGYSDEIDCIKTDDKDIYERIKDYLSGCPIEEQEKLCFYQDGNISLSVLYGIESKLAAALQEKVWLDSGAYLIIQPTEALVAIDVNSGKAIAGKHETEQTFFNINCEAAAEVASQLRLRNLSGIIIVDFIDMREEEHRKELLRKLKEELAKDHITAKVIDMTPLGLVEITRQRIRKPIYEQ